MIAKLLVMGILAGTLAFGQRGGGGRGGGGIDTSTMQMAQVQTRFDRITSALSLNKDQKKEVKASLDEAQKEAAPVREQIAKSRLAIGEAIQGGKGQGEIDQLAASEGMLESQMAGIELKAFAKIFQSLDAEQKQGQGPATVFVMMHGIFSGRNWNSTE